MTTSARNALKGAKSAAKSNDFAQTLRSKKKDAAPTSRKDDARETHREPAAKKAESPSKKTEKKDDAAKEPEDRETEQTRYAEQPEAVQQPVQALPETPLPIDETTVASNVDGQPVPTAEVAACNDVQNPAVMTQANANPEAAAQPVARVAAPNATELKGQLPTKDAKASADAKVVVQQDVVEDKPTAQITTPQAEQAAQSAVDAQSQAQTQEHETAQNAEVGAADARAVAKADSAVANSDQTNLAGAQFAQVEPIAIEDIRQEVATRPVTIDMLNTLLLRGETSPRLALVSPQARPGAVAAASSSEVGNSRPNSTYGEGIVDTQEAETSSFFSLSSSPSHGLGTRETQAHGRSLTPHPSDSTQDVGANGGAPTATVSTISDRVAAEFGQPVQPMLDGTSPQSLAAAIGQPPTLKALGAEDRVIPPSQGTPGIGGIGGASGQSRAESGALGTQTSPQTQARGQEMSRNLTAQVEAGIAQAVQKANADGAASSGAVTIRLRPANLGSLKIHVRLNSGSGESGVKAKFEASSAKTKAILDGSIEGLRTALADKGIKVDEVTVSQAVAMPERDFGLPPVHAQHEHSANFAQDAGAGFAGDQGSGAHGGAGLETGGAGANQNPGTSAESGGAFEEFGGQPVRLAGHPFTIGADGRIRVNAFA